MLLICKQIFSILNKKEKLQVLILFSGIVIRGIVEVAGVASIMPFIAVVSNPSVIHSNKYLFLAYTTLGFQSSRTFLIALGVCVFCFIIFNNTLSALTEWFLIRFTSLRGHSLARRLFAKYLAQPYLFFLNENTSKLGANILNEVSNFLKGILRPFLEMITRVIITLFIFALLLFVDPVLAIIVALTLGSAYFFIYYGVRKKLAEIGKKRVQGSRRKFLYINEALTGIKDIKVGRCEGYFFRAFSKSSYEVSLFQATHQIVSQIPRYALEIIAFGGILLITLYYVIAEKNIEKTIPLVALYAFAGYRLMPALQAVFSGVATVRFNLALLGRLSEDLDQKQYPVHDIQSWNTIIEPLKIENAIELNGVHFFYPDGTQVLHSLDLHIPAKTTVGFAGSTGAGKTTLIDIILGLFTPQQGKLMVDGTVIDACNVRNWQRNIGYVPQQIFLSDQSVRQNIAFGIDDDKIDMNAVERASRISHLHDFIVKELPHGYDTIIGERGVKLSGGQRQRIGIARALYHDPEVLILDEATSSLDNITESIVIDAIRKLAGEKTILMIAHRLTTLIDCDIIHYLKKGKIVDSGTYDNLMTTCPEFRKNQR